MLLWKLECNIHNPAQNFSTEARRKSMNLYLFSNKSVLHKCSPELIECSFDKPAKILSSETRKIFWIYKFLSNKTFRANCSSWKIGMECDSPADNFSPEVQKNLWIEKFFSKKNSPFLPQCSSEKSKLQFWQTCWKCFHRSSIKVYGPINCFKKSFLQKCSLENEKRSFYKLDAIFSPEARRNFVDLQFFSMKNFFLKYSSRNLEFDFDKIAEKFLPKVENVSEHTFFFKLKVLA